MEATSAWAQCAAHGWSSAAAAAAEAKFSKSRPCDAAAANAGCGCADGGSDKSYSNLHFALPPVDGMPVDEICDEVCAGLCAEAAGKRLALDGFRSFGDAEDSHSAAVSELVTRLESAKICWQA